MDFLDGIPSEELGLAPVSFNGQYSDVVNGIKLDNYICFQLMIETLQSLLILDRHR